MLADQLVLRTEQPFPKPLLDFAGALTTQGPNLTSIVRHGPHDDPAEVDFHPKPVYQPSCQQHLGRPAEIVNPPSNVTVR